MAAAISISNAVLTPSSLRPTPFVPLSTMPQLPNSCPPRPPQLHITKRQILLNTLQKNYAETNINLLKCMLSDDEGEDLDTSFDDGGSHTSQPSSPILGLSSPLSSFQGVSPISDHSTLHVCDSSLAPPEADELELVNLLYKKFRVLQDQILSTRYLMARSVPIPHNSQMDLLW
jgi:hypothetical protein